MKVEWTTKFPKKVGNYWFYGYRYGKWYGKGTVIEKKNEPEWMIVKVRKCANGLLLEANGQFFYEKEIEEGHFAPVELPDFPELLP